MNECIIISSKEYKVIIFDGVCILCNSIIIFLRKNLINKNYVFVPSKSNEGKELVKYHNLNETVSESIVLIVGKNTFTKSNAIIEIVNDMPYLYRILKFAKFIPCGIRDWLYTQVAKNRYLLFK